jgi:hypothetical protein
MEIGDAAEVRIDKIRRLIEESRFGIHDLSRTELDAQSQLPRFNMPFELGLFLGAKVFGNKQQRRKSCLILDRDRYRYQQFMSDISGQDIEPHGDDYRAAITVVRNWLRDHSGRPSIPGGLRIQQRYEEFRLALPQLCKQLKYDPEDRLPFNDFKYVVASWLADQ